MKRTLSNALLALVSLGFCGVVAELVLRGFVPRYEEAANARYDPDSVRIRARFPNSWYTRSHPDTGERHLVIHNELSLRQHRSVPETRRPGEVRIGVFGDSFVENLYMAAPYSLTEVLDYLLNVGEGRATVLNFGVSGYGTDQSYLFWRDAPAARDLDHVFYVFSSNDVRNLYENDLFELAGGTVLRQKKPPERPWWVPLISRFHLTYLAIDAKNRVVPWFRGDEWVHRAQVQPLDEQVMSQRMYDERRDRYHDETAERLQDTLTDGDRSVEVDRYVALLQAILERWSEGVRAEGADFTVVLLPRSDEGRVEWIFEGHDVINLWREFEVYGFERKKWKFENDGHWNELGNLLAAVHLYKHLGQPAAPLTDDQIAEANYAYYYGAFEGFRPALWTRPTPLEDAELERIRSRYTELEAAYRQP